MGGSSGRVASCCWSFLIHLFLLMNFGESHDHHQPMEFVNGNGIRVKEGDMIYFTPNDLKTKKGMPIYLHRKDPSTSPPFLSKEEVDQIPFSLTQLPTILRFFSFSPDSPSATAVENALRHCEMEPMFGEIKFCATSLESMLDSVQAALGVGSRFKLLSTTHRSNSGVGVHVQNYTFLETPKETMVKKYVSCHSRPYPYAVYHCHQLKGGSMIVEIKLKGEDGEIVDAVANCHIDTSHFSPKHTALKALNIRPGTVPLCHFFPEGDLLWVPVSPIATT